MRMTNVVLWLLIILFATAASAEDWPCWRGAGRDGVVRGFLKPATWPAELKKLWSVEVGEGHASPIVVSERIFLLTRQGESEVVSCFNLAGEPVWQQRYPAPYEMSPDARSHGKGPKSTPALADGRLYTLGISGILSAWNTEDGQRLWQHEFARRYPKTSPLYGTAMSPLATERYVFAHVGGHDRGAFTAFEARTGNTISAWDQDGPGYASPVLAKLADTAQLITQTQTLCIGLTGNGKLLWSLPFKTDYLQNSVTPIVFQDLVIFSGYNQGLTAYRLRKTGEQFLAEQVWHNEEVSLYMNSPVLIGDRLFGFSQRKSGQLACVEPRAGKTVWTGPARQGENAALLAADRTLVALTNESQLLFCDATAPEYKPLAKYRVAETPTWAHPVLIGKKILVKDATHLTLLEL